MFTFFSLVSFAPSHRSVKLYKYLLKIYLKFHKVNYNCRFLSLLQYDFARPLGLFDLFLANFVEN